MSDHTYEIGVRDVRARFSAAIHDVSVRGYTVYITNNGRRVAALVSVPVAEEAERQAEE